MKNRRICYLTLPLLIMATVVEFVILATGWTYQKTVCVPQGMGVLFFGIGPIGATILAVELLKLPLAIWTASRHGWQKTFMLIIGLPLICVLTFQLVKDMAVYEMGVAMTPASQLLEKAAAEEVKIGHLNGELAAIEAKKADRQSRLAELAAKRKQASAELEELLKRNDESRQDAINLTDYQKKELSEVEARKANITKQFNADTEQLNKALAELRARRETELARASKWTTEEARIENAYKAKMVEYTNKKAAYDKEKAEYITANFLRRQLMKEPVSPGVPPEREVNSLVKPTAIAEFDAEIKAKEAELLAVNNKRRESVAQVDADARRLREEYDRRSSTRREKTDSKREELAAAQAALTAELNAEEKQADQELSAAVKKVDGIRAEIDACRKKAEGHYEEREASIRNTQVHRIATTVEIVRGLIMGERPMSITATAKERGDILTDQISMVRIWVYPVLAFIVAFLPTLMVEIGSSTVFKVEPVRPPHRLGFLGRRMHWLYKRAGRQKILRAERLAIEASAEVTTRDRALEAAKAAAAEQEERIKKMEEVHAEQLAGMADSLNRAAAETAALRESQNSEVERQIRTRQDAWSDRLTQMRKELDDQRAAFEAERATLKQEHQEKLMQVTEDCKAQILQVRRQMADAELAAVEKSGKLTNELKQALHARDEVESQLKRQVDSLAHQIAQAQEDAARQTEKTAREEKHRLDRQQLEFEKTLRQREEDFEHRLKQREQEMALVFEGQLAEEKNKLAEAARFRQAELERQIENRAREVEGRWKQEVQRREEATQIRFRQREHQWQTQGEARVSEMQTQAERELSRRMSELKHELEAKSHEAETRLHQELQEKELVFQARLKEREQELAARADARESELQKQWVARLRAREEELERQAEARVRATEDRLGHELKEKEQAFLAESRQQEAQWQLKLDGVLAELQLQTAAIEPYKERLAQAENERDEARQSAAESARQVQNLERKLKEASSFLSGWKDKLADAA
ncbi:MAG: hypothetical protein L0Y58_17125 [Verrucomicrobia subdivision 3 bacterium]|nr:hypothetical protein [Limisphaerales bacterium]